MNIKSIIKPNQLLNPYFTAIIIAIIAIFLLPTTTHAATNTVNILIKGEPVQFTDQTGRPFIDSNARTLVPMRIVMEKYGCTVDWEQESLSAIVKKGDVTVKVPTMQKFIMVNNVRQDTDTQPQNINGRIYLPVAAVLRAFGADVQWDDESRSVVVDKVESSSITNPNSKQPISSDKDVVNNSVGMVKPEGYDEFMKDFEVVKIIPREHKVNFIIRNSTLPSSDLENHFKSIPENNLKNYMSYLTTLHTDYLTYPEITLWFYSNITELSREEGIKGNLWEGRVLISFIYRREQGETVSLFYPNWREYIGR